MNTYTPVIGLEVHVELKTNSKMFCRCSADYFGKEPNTHTCPVCLGLPGALPVPNKKAIDWCVMIGQALNCEIPLFAKFDRKNYFYPDLAKGYQISQYDEPFAINGSLTLHTGKTIKIRRAHMEEDTGKLIHSYVNGEEVSLIDFNRSGVPLVEIVTEPDFEDAKEVTEYLQKLQQIVRYLNVANADMEKGEMRLEPNISLRQTNPPPTPSIGGENKRLSPPAEGTKGRVSVFDLPKYKVEVKNINSFSFVEDAITYEIKRQAEILDKNEIPAQETRGWNEDKKKTISQRSKEEAQDYRYFPEPDIPPIRWTQSQIEEIQSHMPELPDQKFNRFVQDYSLSEYNAEILTREKPLADYFEEAVRVNNELKNKNEKATDEKTIANWMINKKVSSNDVLPAELVKQIIVSQQVSGISDQELETVLRKVLSENPKPVEDYKSGKENVVMFLLGQAMKELKGKEKAEKVKEAIQKLLRSE
jgi:aspartyl-tRNA(Asn)/glutamyl-tRNA(Gln) amidotransferase subunit B